MPKPAKKPQSILHALADKSTPAEQRYLLLRTLVNDTNLESIANVHALLEHMSVSTAESLYAEKVKELEELLELLQSGPMRNATFIELVRVGKIRAMQALVVLDDGTYAYTTVPEESLAKELRRGDRV